jgi:hypothetical protein
VALAAVVLGGMLITVPTHATAPGTVVDAARCGELGAQPGPGGCVVVGLDPRRVGLPPTGTRAQLTTPDGTASSIDVRPVGDTLVGPLPAAVPPGSPVTATVEVGRRALALVFLGHGLEAHP